MIPGVTDFRQHYDLMLFDPDIKAMRRLKVISDEECLSILEAEWDARFAELVEQAHAKGLKEEYVLLFADLCSKDYIKGYARSFVQGVIEGREKASEETARLMLTNGEPLDKITKYTHLTIKQIQSLPMTQN